MVAELKEIRLKNRPDGAKALQTAEEERLRQAKEEKGRQEQEQARLQAQAQQTLSQAQEQARVQAQACLQAQARLQEQEQARLQAQARLQEEEQARLQAQARLQEQEQALLEKVLEESRLEEEQARHRDQEEVAELQRALQESLRQAEAEQQRQPQEENEGLQQRQPQEENEGLPQERDCCICCEPVEEGDEFPCENNEECTRNLVCNECGKKWALEKKHCAKCRKQYSEAFLENLVANEPVPVAPTRWSEFYHGRRTANWTIEGNRYWLYPPGVEYSNGHRVVTFRLERSDGSHGFSFLSMDKSSIEIQDAGENYRVGIMQHGHRQEEHIILIPKNDEASMGVVRWWQQYFGPAQN